VGTESRKSWARWKPTSPSDIYVSCLSKGHRPVLVRATFQLLYFYCDKCHRVYRVAHGDVRYCEESEWPGKPLK